MSPAPSPQLCTPDAPSSLAGLAVTPCSAALSCPHLGYRSRCGELLSGCIVFVCLLVPQGACVWGRVGTRLPVGHVGGGGLWPGSPCQHWRARQRVLKAEAQPKWGYHTWGQHKESLRVPALLSLGHGGYRRAQTGLRGCWSIKGAPCGLQGHFPPHNLCGVWL